MKKTVAVITGLSLVFLSGSPAFAKRFYKTFEVVKVTEKVFVLQKKDG